MLHQTAATHKLGGTLDAVITREDVGCPDRVKVVDVGLSDHHLLQWSVDATRSEVPAVVELRRSWRRLDIDQFRCMLTSSSLCQPDSWPSDIEDMAAMYNHELNVLLDQLIPDRSKSISAVQQNLHGRQPAECQKVHILQAVDRGDFAALVLLDLSATFDTVDHEILIQRLQSTYSIHGSVLQWFRSYLLGRTQHVRRGSCSPRLSQIFSCSFGLGSMPTTRLCDRSDSLHFIHGGPGPLFESLGLSSHLYADDTQIYGSCPASHVDMFLSEVTNCIAAVADWMQSNRLQLNDNKTEFMVHNGPSSTSPHSPAHCRSYHRLF